jgi:hypothetical protein
LPLRTYNTSVRTDKQPVELEIKIELYNTHEGQAVNKVQTLYVQEEVQTLYVQEEVDGPCG